MALCCAPGVYCSVDRSLSSSCSCEPSSQRRGERGEGVTAADMWAILGSTCPNECDTIMASSPPGGEMEGDEDRTAASPWRWNREGLGAHRSELR